MKKSRFLRHLAPASLAVLALLGTACPSGSPPEAPPAAGPIDEASATPEAAPMQAKAYDLEIPMVTYKWDPQAGDPTVSAEDGGPGFTGEGWESNMTFPALGSPDAVKGGRMVRRMADWPATLRQAGKDWNMGPNYAIRSLAMASLLQPHPNTLDFIPMLATHWWISPDKMTYRFRLNPEARWSNGAEVTSEDVIESLRLRVDPTILEPSNIVTFGKMEPPTAVSKYIVEIKVKQENWRNFLYFTSMTLFPSHQIKGKSGGDYLSEFNFKFTDVCGAYAMSEQDVDMGKSVSLRRRADWWDADNPAWTGVYNIDEYRWVVIKDDQLAFEKSKQLELDFWVVPKAQWWVEEYPKVDTVERGLLLQRKFYSDYPIGTSGIAINMTVPGLDDVRVRKALQYLYDRETMIEKLYFNEYEPLNSYWQGGTYQNPDNEYIPYDEFAGVELLEQAGWTEIDSEGYRVKDGKRLDFKVTYRSKLSERNLTTFQEACKRAGIRIELQLLTPAAGWKNLRQKEYELFSTAWGALVFPNPETSWSSKFADKVDTNNVTAFADPRVDELMVAYDEEYDVQRRKEIVQEIDALIYEQHPYVLGWFNPAIRVVLTNKFSWPEWGSWRTSRYDYIHQCWWVDPAKHAAFEEARADSSKSLPRGEVKIQFWPAWNAAQRAKATSAGQPGS